MNFPSKEQRLDVRKKPDDQSFIIHQKWRDLFFIHYKCDPQEIQKTLPEGLFVDTFEDNAYVGIVPFRMQEIRPRYIPTLPGFSNFLELNVRTYVYDEKGNPGVWFYSLDTNRSLAAFLGRTTFYLPYSHASMQDTQAGRKFLYQSNWNHSAKSSIFELSHENNFQEARNDTLEFFLIERYLLFAKSSYSLYSGRIFHHPYLFSKAKIHYLEHDLLKRHDIQVLEQDPCHVMYSPGVDVKTYSLKRL